MDTEHRSIAALLALKDAPDDMLLDQVRAIGVTATRYMLFEAQRDYWLAETNLQTALDCISLIDCIA